MFVINISRNALVIYLVQCIFCMLSLSLMYVVGNIKLGLFFLICNYVISFLMVNIETKNLFNVSTFFLSGFGFLILGRVISKFLLLDFSNIELIFCTKFFFHYCMSDDQIYFLNFILNITLISFCMGYVLKFSRISRSSKDSCCIENQKQVLLLTFLLIVGVYLIFNGWKKIYIAISEGYMALYAGQAESYQTPVNLFLSSFFLAGLAIVANITENQKILFVRVLIGIFLLNLAQLILTGARGGAISSILFLMWYLTKDRRISVHHYVFLFLGLGLLVSFLNAIASFSGARAFAGGEMDVWKSFVNVFYEQGGTMMLVNSSLYIQEISFWAYIKTIVPGIQFFYSYFDIYDRYLFDWSSALAYQENKFMYEQGFGLGWSILSDFYLLSFKVVPIYYILFLLFGTFLKYLTTDNFSPFRKGILFIMVSYVFSLSRSSISPVIFCIVIYSLMFFLVVRKKEF
ncbi:O-antigen polysaccharide polymerase Wzy [Conchiformibius steedae]|uniref:O-antigen polysaccharide polymerase Wzy n=1 Tax=Conchiformibius steedae TaxID=153493 RepID=A0A3P2A936_9NEIS|nr:O-antigen polysaccharide polymerase Wzy [Conchiformibius steedae]RRD91306.1 O-antigen polysaccharide polymerase Wzy [Conchiformibius steedae]